MKSKSNLSIFALQQRSSRPGATVVLIVFTLIYLLYLGTLLVINMQKGWFAVQNSNPEEIAGYNNEVYIVDRSAFNEVYPFEYYFKSTDYSYRDNGVRDFTNSTTPFLIRSEIMFLISLAAMVLALTMAHVKINKGSDTIKRLPYLNSSVKVMQWMSDCAYVLLIWLAHLAVIFLFYVIYMFLAPIELKYPQNLYALFTGERYLYMLFPVLNPISLIRMLSLVLAVSFIPSFAFSIINDMSQKDSYGDGIPYGNKIFRLILLIGLICWGYFASSHIWSIIVCIAAMVIGYFLTGLNYWLNRSQLNEWESIDAEKSI